MGSTGRFYWVGVGVESSLGLDASEFGIRELRDDDAPDIALGESMREAAAHMDEAVDIFNTAVDEAQAAGIDVDSVVMAASRSLNLPSHNRNTEGNDIK